MEELTVSIFTDHLTPKYTFDRNYTVKTRMDNHSKNIGKNTLEHRQVENPTWDESCNVLCEKKSPK